MVVAFKTNVTRKRSAHALRTHLASRFPEYHTSFDLEDCDKVLRVESTVKDIDIAGVIDALGHRRFRCEVLT